MNNPLLLLLLRNDIYCGLLLPVCIHLTLVLLTYYLCLFQLLLWFCHQTTLHGQLHSFLGWLITGRAWMCLQSLFQALTDGGCSITDLASMMR